MALRRLVVVLLGLAALALGTWSAAAGSSTPASATAPGGLVRSPSSLDLAADRPWTVTGGMPYAGGPLNNFVLQATCKVAQCLRAQPTANGLVTSVSGLLTKQGFGIWAARPPHRAFRFDDVTAAVRAEATAREVVTAATGNAVIVGYTVLYQQGRKSRAVAVLELADGRRTLGWNDDPRVMEDMETAEFVGRSVAVSAGQFSP